MINEESKSAQVFNLLNKINTSPALQAHIQDTDKERLEEELWLWHGLTREDIETNLAFVPEDQRIWVWW